MAFEEAKRHPILAVMVFLAVVNTFGVYIALFALLFFPVPTENRELVSMMIGNILGFVAGIVTYHFGSSKDSHDKNATIATQAASQLEAQRVITANNVPSDQPTVVVEPGHPIQVAASEPPDGRQDTTTIPSPSDP